MSGIMRLDTREFNQALREYIVATGKDSAEALNRQARNFAIKCIGTAKKPKGSAAIRALKSEAWWPKIVAKIMVKRAGAAAGSKIFQAQWASAKRAKGIKAGKDKNSFKLDKEEQSYAKEARRISSDILKSRTGAISFLRFFFRVMAARMSQFAKGSAIPAGKVFPGFNGQVLPANPSRLSVAMTASYGFKRRGSKSASGAENELQKAMTAALPVTVSDMKQYTEKQLAKRALQFSGKK